MDCIFCKIIEGKIPSAKVYEDEDVFVMLDIQQSTKGHTLIIPKKHVKDIYELSEGDTANIYRVVPKIAHAIKKVFNSDGLNIINNNGETAGQTVFHYHVHLIPRYKGDDVTIKYSDNTKLYSTEQLVDIGETIAKKI